MYAENIEIVDVECRESAGVDESIREPICESIQVVDESTQVTGESIQWMTASEARHKTRLNKTPFQRAIAELVREHQIPISSLRRGEARNTQYSCATVALIEALKSGDVAVFEELKKSFVPPPIVSLTVGASEHTVLLTSKIQGFVQKASTEAEVLAVQFRETLDEMARRRRLSQEESATLSEAQIIAARNRGRAMALQIVATEQAAQDEALAQLRSMGL